MIHADQYETAASSNERSLNTLSRAIALSEGQFSPILVRCNYVELRDRITAQLHERTKVDIQELELPTPVHTLYKTIEDHIGKEPPQALMVFGLESVSHVERLLVATNQVREEFRKSFPFPLALWVDDRILRTLIRVAPDFESWATTIEFSFSTEELILTLQNKIERVFSAVLQAGSNQFLPNNFILGSRSCLELGFAKRDLKHRGVELDPKLEASLQFVLGRDDYTHDRIDEAIAQYRESLAFWQQYEAEDRPVKTGYLPSSAHQQNHHSSNRHVLDIPLTANPSPLIWDVPVSPDLVQQGVLLFHLGLCYCRLGELHQAQRSQHLQRARHYLEQGIEVFETSRRSELVAKFIGQLGEILQRLEEWEALSSVAKKSLKLHQIHGGAHQLAQDYGFLAEVALQQSKWKAARDLAQRAIETLKNVPTRLMQQHESLYLLLLARALAALGQHSAAIEPLEKACNQSDPQYDLQLYRRILETLRSLYFAQSRYLEAFEIKQEQRAVEAQFGLRAFIGAGRLQSQRQSVNPSLAAVPQPANIALEIAASGREDDVNRLIERLGRNDKKLTVIHGESGVGKSSLVQAGLVPALKQTAIGARNALPVVLQVYTDWVGTLDKLLSDGLLELGFDRGDRKNADKAGIESLSPTKVKLERILNELQQNNDRNLLTVLIFDQFEEFFFVWTDPLKRQDFYEFLRQCLNLPFIKVILSLREDYLHYLLECDRLGNLEVVDRDILTKEIRYYLGNLSRVNAKNVIERLTERAQLYLQPALIDELVDDLAGKLGEVRPIELQVVGAQLQAENITTLEHYRQSGPKEKLVERFLEEVIADCGPENDRTARLVLYFLTDESGIRPLKTRAEILADLAPEVTGKPEKIDLVLAIFEKAGLVFMVREVPANRYQLVHDYLVTFIRQQEQIKASLKALRQELNEKTQLLDEKNQLLGDLEESRQKERKMQKRLNRFYWGALVGSAIAIGALAWLTGQAISERKKAAIAEIEAQNLASKALLLSNNELGGLLAGVKAGTKLSNAEAPLELQMETVNRLEKAVYSVTERNRLEGHKNSVVSVSFSPQGDTIATASTDSTVRLWTNEGREITTSNPIRHSDWIRDISWSPDGEILATASVDNTVKLWKRDGTLIKTLTEHRNGVTSVSFSANGELMATASRDKTAKIWTRDGRLLRSLSGHSEPVTSVSFSPNGELLATASLDKTVKVWDTRTGKLLRTLKGHEQGVTRVSFSPDGGAIASASADNTVKLWKPDGSAIATLSGHTDWVLGVAFSPDGETIATASKDNTVMLWRRDGNRIRVLRGHRDQVWSVGFSPDGQTIASASSDNTVKLWNTYPRELPAFKGHQGSVLVVSFSPNGKALASASRDNTVKVWRPDGTELVTLKGHRDAVWNLSFSPDGELFATASEDTTVNIWSKSRQASIATLEGHKDSVLAVSFSPDGQRIVSGSEDGIAIVWSRKGERLLTIPAHSGGINNISFSPDGQQFATASGDSTVKIWNLEGKLLATLAGHQGQVYSVSFSPIGDRIATASQDNTIKLWTRNGELMKTVDDHIGPVYWVSFSPNGQLMASASEDKTVKVWSAEGNLLTTLEGHTEPVLSLSFSPDGKTIASSSKDETVILWNLDLDDLLTRGCSWLDNYLEYNATVKPSDRDLCDVILMQKKVVPVSGNQIAIGH